MLLFAREVLCTNMDVVKAAKRAAKKRKGKEKEDDRYDKRKRKKTKGGEAVRPPVRKRKRISGNQPTSEDSIIRTDRTNAKQDDPQSVSVKKKFVPTQFWTHATHRFSDNVIPKADGISNRYVEIKDCGDTWFTARRFYQDNNGRRRRDWRSAIEPTLPLQFQPVNLVPAIVNKRSTKKTIDGKLLFSSSQCPSRFFFLYRF